MKTGLPADSHGRACEKVRELILLGQLKPGAWVSQVRVGAQLELSRPPLREELRRLETKGLVQLDFNRRRRAAPLSVADLKSLSALRILTEPPAVRLSTPVLSEHQLAAATQALADTNAAADRNEQTVLLRAHRRFHFTLISEAEHRLRNHVESMSDHAVLYMRAYHLATCYRMSLVLLSRPEHDQILGSPTARHADMAARLTAEHFAGYCADGDRHRCMPARSEDGPQGSAVRAGRSAESCPVSLPWLAPESVARAGRRSHPLCKSVRSYYTYRVHPAFS
jgi:DNA-binding GntR family transcriptional regulator